MAPAATITHAKLTHLIEAGTVNGAHVVGQPGGWAVVVKYDLAERALAAERSKQVRIFRKFETLTAYLRDVGIVRFDVDATDYDPAVPGARRPDRANALRQAHEAREHDRWFRQQVETALASPNPQWIEHDALFDQLEAETARLVEARNT